MVGLASAVVIAAVAALPGCSARPDEGLPQQAGQLLITVRGGPQGPPTIDQDDAAQAAGAPVAGAEVIVVDEAGQVVERLTTAADGSAAARLPAGRYELRPQPVAGYLGTAPQTQVEVAAGVDRHVVLDYDTGIR